MKTKMGFYRVVSVIGRINYFIYQTKPFDLHDGHSSSLAWEEALLEKAKHCKKLWDEGYSRSVDGRYHHIGKNLDGGRIEVFLYIR